MIQIREATKKDLEAILDLWEEFTGNLHMMEPDFFQLKLDARELYRKKLKKQIHLPYYLVLVAKDEEAIVGYHIASIRYPGEVFVQKPYGHISDLYLQAGYHGQNLGRQLIEYTMGWLIDRGIRDVDVKTFSANPEGVNFWKKNGFSLYEVAFKMKL